MHRAHPRDFAVRRHHRRGSDPAVDSDAAAHFSFLLAAPIIGGAAILEVPKLVHAVHEGASGRTT